MSSTYAEPFARLEACLDEIGSVDPVYRTTAEKQEALVGLSRVIARAQAEQQRVLAVADDVAEATGDRSTAAWLATATRDSHGAVRASAKLAAALETRWTRLAAVFAAGGVNLAQVRVIDKALSDLPRDLGDDLLGKAEVFLVEQAAELGPRDLAVLGGRVLEENIPTDRLPAHGGTATSVVFTVDHDVLLADLHEAGIARTATGGQVTIGQLRRLACQADLLPAVLGGRSEVLDLGRRRRLFSRPQRIAMKLRDKTCTAVGCSMPAEFCEDHHKERWSRGGRTDLADGTLLRPFHHRRAHDIAWVTAYHPAGATSFTRHQSAAHTGQVGHPPGHLPSGP